ncbi:MAG: signal peptidase II [Anaerolineales bacterium]|nr:signal peptidase II [Anaerolineales bacterium]
MLKVRNYILLAILAGTVLILDQTTKELVRTQLALGEIWMPIEAIRPHMHIVHWTNTGAAFGMFQQGGMVFTILAVIVSGAIIWYYRDSDTASWPVRIALGLQLGGALGNLTDRLLQGTEVTDFIWFGFFPAVFNVADGAISLGVALLMLDILLEYLHNRKKSAAAAAAAAVPPPEKA